VTDEIYIGGWPSLSSLLRVPRPSFARAELFLFRSKGGATPPVFDSGNRCGLTIYRAWNPARSLLQHLVDDVLRNLLHLAPIRVTRPHDSTVAIAYQPHRSLNFITIVNAKPQIPTVR